MSNHESVHLLATTAVCDGERKLITLEVIEASEIVRALFLHGNSNVSHQGIFELLRHGIEISITSRHIQITDKVKFINLDDIGAYC